MTGVPSTSLEKTIRVARRLDAVLNKQFPQVRSTLASIGRSELGNTTDANYMEVLVDTKPEDQCTERTGPTQLTKQMQEALEKAIPTVVFSATQPIQMRVEERFPAFETV